MSFIFDGFGQITHEFSIPGPGSPAMVTYGISDNAIQTPDAIAGFAAQAWIAANSMITGQDSNTTLVATRVLLRRSGNLLAGQDFATQAGSLSGEGAPPQVAMLFQKQTGFAGRNRRGRFYLPGIVAVGETGVLAAGTVTIYQGRADIFMGLLASAGIDMYLLHVNPADPPNAITDLVAVGTTATQRRRIR